jgi:hypothetical protein
MTCDSDSKPAARSAYRRSFRQSCSIDEKVALCGFDVVQGVALSVPGGCRDHVRIDVERVHDSGRQTGRGDRECPITAADVDHVFMPKLKPKSSEGLDRVEEAGPDLLVRHSAISDLHISGPMLRL